MEKYSKKDNLVGSKRGIRNGSFSNLRDFVYLEWEASATSL
jgi:hypothetical protein